MKVKSPGVINDYVNRYQKHDKRTFANIYNRTVLFTFRVYLNKSKIECGIDGLAVLKFPF